MDNRNQVLEISRYWRNNVDACRKALADYRLEVSRIPRSALEAGERFTEVRKGVIKQLENAMFLDYKAHTDLESKLYNMSPERLEKILDYMKETIEGSTLEYIKNSTKSLRIDIERSMKRANTGS